MDALYPPLTPYDSGLLDVGDGNRVYWEVCGNPEGKPAVVLHGGPGAGTSPLSRRHFDPSAYRIVLFDQRGAGRSVPSITAPETDLGVNTTWHLVADMERLREHLGIERWLVFGGSWGATLALAYAETHPRRVSEMVLRGVFTVRQRELDWLYRGGAAQLYPEYWAEFLEPLPPERRDDPLAGYAELLADPGTREAAAVAWSSWEGSIGTLIPDERLRNAHREPGFALTFARAGVHYFTHGAWLEEGQLIRDAGRLAGIPGFIVQGRYDVVCPPATAYELYQAWPGARLCLVNNAGHAVTEPETLKQLRIAMDEFRGSEHRA
ncbi:prolyl aminopeptidase [Amycolatopsis sacchari]|uniref:prolyl aminopeptidase n=1 Tax=Amycolatopsis sacchari TaxID=115433 RepID=UPI003EBF3CA6